MTANREIVMTGLAHLRAWSRKTETQLDDFLFTQMAESEAVVNYLESMIDKVLPDAEAFSLPIGLPDMDFQKVWQIIQLLQQLYNAVRPLFPTQTPKAQPGQPELF